MKKIINQVGDVLEQMVSGIVKSQPGSLELVEGTSVIKQKKLNDQVSLVSGGGSGHEPSHAGFVGDGMLQVAICGQVFTSPSSNDVLEAIKAVILAKVSF